MTSRITLITLAVLFFIGCNDSVKTSRTPQLTINDTLPIDYIRGVSIRRKLHYNLDSLNLSVLEPIDSSFFKKWFANTRVNGISDFRIEFGPYSRFYFLDHRHLNNNFLFSIIHNDEVGYSTLYHFNYNKAKKILTQTDLIGQTGGDGGHSNIDVLDYNSQGDVLRITSVSTFEEDFGQGFTQQYDSIITKVVFGSKETKYAKLDSFSQPDTVFRK